MFEMQSRLKLEESLDRLSKLASQIVVELRREGCPGIRNIITPEEMAIVLRAPVGPQRFRDDTVVMDGSGWYRIMTPSSPSPSYNEVFFSRLSTEVSDQEIDTIIGEYHQRGLAFTWCVYPWTKPTDLGTKLLARGAKESSMVAFIGSSDSPTTKRVLGIEIEVVEPTANDSLESYISLVSEGFELTPEDAAFRRERYPHLMTGPPHSLRLLLARIQEAVAGCMLLILKKDSAHMSGVYVRPEFQARGVFPTLNASAQHFLRDMGIPLATGHSNPLSAFWVERFGAKPVFAYSMYRLDPPG